GGVDIWDVAGWVDPDHVVAAGPPFMGDESMGAIGHAVREATEIGLEVGLTISSSWNAGGSWVEPRDGVMGLFRSRVVIDGPAQFSEALPFPDLPERYNRRLAMILVKDSDGLPTYYEDVAVLAIPDDEDSTLVGRQAIDISDKYKEGVLTWDVPEGSWTIVRYVGTGTGQPLMAPSPNSNGLMIDHFSAEATTNHLMFFINKLQEELGDFENTSLNYLYTDSYEANSAVWTRNMEGEFMERNGYSLLPYLPVLDGYIVESKDISDRFLFDFKKTLSDLIIENHYVLGTEICAEYGLGFNAEAGGPGPPIHNCPFESLKSLGSLSVPRGEFWFNHGSPEKQAELQIVKGPASAAHLYNQPQVEAEAFTSAWVWQEGPGDLKEVMDKALCEGLTRFVYHTTPHIVPESGTPGWIYNFGTLVNTTRAWWPLSRPFHDYIGRSCYMLQQGNFVGDVLYYYGDQAPNFADPKHIDPSLGYGYDYDVCNSDIILNRLDVKNGSLVLPHGQKYEVLVLPDQEAMDPDVLEKIVELVEKGATVIGNKPVRSHSLQNYLRNDERIRELANRLWGKGKVKRKNSYGQGMIYSGENSIRSVLIEKGIGPDLEVDGEEPGVLDYIHRTTRDSEIYFVRNTADHPLQLDAIFRVKQKHPEFWDPQTGKRIQVNNFRLEEKGVKVGLDMDPLGSVFIVFREEHTSNPVSEVRRDGSVLFPVDSAKRTFVMSDEKFYGEENGAYILQFVNGDKLEMEIRDIPGVAELEGPWEIRFPFGWGAPPKAIFDELISWTDSEDDGIKHFSGIGSYHKSFEMKEELVNPEFRIILDLGSLSKMAEVFLNGRRLQTLWNSPFEVDVTGAVKPGTNYLVVNVANVMSNQLTGDAGQPERLKRTHSNITKGPNAWMYPWKDVPLIESGLMGPVTIKYTKQIDLTGNE
ncbi:MAG: hypothetical protein KAT15_22960, partial [Bacteroidales bacterium]|nr:hypothetical protein [Bacteroidales bacterium]